MKIDLIISSLTSGGAERVVSLLANEFANRGHEVRLLTFDPVEDAFELDPRIKRIKYKKSFYILNFTSIKCLLFLIFFYLKKSNRPDLISSHATLMGYATIPIAKLYNIKLTVTEHTNHLRGKHSINNWLLWKYLYKFPNAITVLTNYDLSYFQKKNKNVHVIHNPCSFRPIQDSRIKREKLLLVVGNLNRYEIKGFDKLLEIVSKILPKHPDWKLKIVGSGNEGIKILQKIAEDLKIANQVIFTGFRSDVHYLMQQAEIFILSSKFEGLPMALLEAMTQKMACISYDCISGPSEIITNNINGILVKNQDQEDMAYQLNRIIKDEGLRESLRKNIDGSLKKFSIEAVADKWENLFSEILN